MRNLKKIRRNGCKEKICKSIETIMKRRRYTKGMEEK